MTKVAVIGTGILGASAAYELAKSGSDVIMIDREDTGQATDAAAGIICPWLSQRRNKAWYALATGGARIYPELIQELAKDGETETGYAQTGALSLHYDETKLMDKQQRVIKRREDAPEIGDVKFLNATETKTIFPYINESYASIYITGAARVNGRAMRNALIRGAKKHNAQFINGNARLLHEGSQITGVSVNGETIETDTVIAACGVWMSELLEPLNITFNVTSQKAQILHLQSPDKDTSAWPVVMPPNSQFMLTWDDRIIVGATHENNAGLDSRVTAGGIEEILSKALDIAPGLSETTILESRAGFRPHTSGSLPVIGPLPGINGLLIGNGLGSSGLTTGPFAGRQLAHLALGNKPAIDLADYDVTNTVTYL